MQSSLRHELNQRRAAIHARIEERAIKPRPRPAPVFVPARVELSAVEPETQPIILPPDRAVVLVSERAAAVLSSGGCWHPKDLIFIAAAAFGLNVKWMAPPRRKRIATRARWTAMWLLRRFTALSSPQIGRLIGRLDHTTVLHGLDRTSAFIARRRLVLSDDPAEAALTLAAAFQQEIQRPPRVRRRA